MAAPLLFHHDSSYEHDTGAHPESARRLEAIERQLEERDWLGWERREAPAAALEAIRAVHSERHVERIREASERGGARLDPDTVASSGSYRAALHAAGGACAMVDALLGSEAPLGFCALRPPGHHATEDRAMGFCLFNNVAVAARHALESLGAKRVFVFDWDVHHGNGTNDIFHATDAVLYASIHQSPLYPGTGPLDDAGEGEGEGYSINLPVPPGSGEDVWLALVEHVVMPAARRYAPDLVLISAGFDAHRAEQIASCRLETGSFAQMARHVRRLADELEAPAGAVLEGGYALGVLGESVAATLEALAEGGQPRSVEADEVTGRAAECVGRHWDLELAEG